MNVKLTISLFKHFSNVVQTAVSEHCCLSCYSADQNLLDFVKFSFSRNEMRSDNSASFIFFVIFSLSSSSLFSGLFLLVSSENTLLFLFVYRQINPSPKHVTIFCIFLSTLFSILIDTSFIHGFSWNLRILFAILCGSILLMCP